MIGHVAFISDINNKGEFSVQGAHNSTGTDIVTKGKGENGYFTSLDEWGRYLGQDILGIGQQTDSRDTLRYENTK